MKTTTTAALSLLLCAMFALPQASLAAKPDRNPSEKDCPFATMSSCAAELAAAYDLVGALFANNEVVETFLSRNPERDSGTLQCKISGADIKLAQDKADEASYLMQVSIEKIWSLYSQGKLSWDGLVMMEAAFNTAKDCIDNP